jgi:hypothetical protein
VLNDWVSFNRVLEEIARHYRATETRFHVLAVNDGSAIGSESAQFPALITGAIGSLEVLHLAVNLGHQRAIAVGLSILARRDDIATVIVMDSDQEDRPQDISVLLATGDRHPGKVVLARRIKRSEGVGFKIGYYLYKLVFSLLTGQSIDFGNFSLIPMEAVRRLVRMPELWNNLPASIMRSRLATVAVPLPRGQRYAGRSRMKLSGLIVHGLSAMSVFSEVIFVRVLLAALCAGGLLMAAMFAVLAIRLMTDLAIPGWASTVFGDLAILLVQLLVIIVAITFMVLSGRSNRPIIPFTDAPSFVVDHEIVRECIVSSLTARL